MDLDEWEFLPDDRLLDYHDDGSEHQRKVFSGVLQTDPKTSVFDMNYFICPSPNSQKTIQTVHQVLPVPIQLETKIICKAPHDRDGDGDGEDHAVGKINDNGSTNIGGGGATVTVDQVFFKKMKENEFVDMKMDSPKTNSKGGIMSPLDVGAFPNDGKAEPEGEEMGMKVVNSPRLMTKKSSLEESNETIDKECLDIWKWSLTGVGAICSFGIAAATICFLFLGSHHRNKHQHSHKLRFQIYTDDKRINQVVQQASKLNDAISAVRGVPINRAHITFGGYYDAL